MIEITYHKEGDYFIPNLYLKEDNYKKDYRIGKYGHLRLEYLKNNKRAEHTIMFMDSTLRKHIVDTDIQARERFELLMKQFIEKENITENLKATNQLEWVCKMNNIKNCVEEIILKELIYV